MPPSPLLLLLLLLLLASVAVRGEGPRAMGDRWSAWWVALLFRLVWVGGRQRATGSGQQAAGDGQRREMGSGRRW